MNEFLVYRFPNQAIEKWSGTWRKVDLEQLSLAETHFVLSDFSTSHITVFDKEKPLGKDEILAFGSSKQSAISKEDYLETLSDMMQKMEERKIDKVIFSRIKSTQFDSTTFFEFIEILAEKYPTAFVYGLYAKDWGYWIGASPEVLLKQQENTFQTVALAGTLGVNDKTDWSEKEKEEQQYVSDYVQQIIERNGTLLNRSERKEKIAGPVKHLQTIFDFELSDEKLISFIKALHPTPAICGVPLEKAKKLIVESEKHQRKLYAGFLGNLGGGKTTLYVNLRCMSCFENTADIFVGGGITASSIPEKEWEETERKASTLTHILAKTNE